MSRPKHRTNPAATYFVTTNTWQRRALFSNPSIAEVVERKLFEYRDKGCYLVHSYVVMTEHAHVILTPGPTTTLEKVVQLFKGGSSREIGKLMPLRYPVWQAGFTEHQVRNEEDFQTHSKYIDTNPVKARLVGRPENYLFSSANGKFKLDPWTVASGAEAQGIVAAPMRRG